MQVAASDDHSNWKQSMCASYLTSVQVGVRLMQQQHGITVICAMAQLSTELPLSLHKCCILLQPMPMLIMHCMRLPDAITHTQVPVVATCISKQFLLFIYVHEVL